MRQAIKVLESALNEIGGREPALLLPLASLQVDVRDWDAVADSVRRIEPLLDELPERVRSKASLGLSLIQTRLLWENAGPYPAIRHLESAVGDDTVRIHRELSRPLFAQAHLLLGRLYSSVRILDRATEQYRLAMQLAPDSVAIRIEAIAPALNSGDLESAELLCRQLLRDDPDCSEALLAMIRLQVRKQIRQPIEIRSWKAAERAYELARDRKVSRASLFLAQVELVEAQGKVEEAKQLLQAALELTPEEPALWRESALLLERSGELELALQSARKYAELEPDEVEPHVMQATLLEKTNRSQAAEQQLAQLLSRSSGRRWVQAALQLARLKLLLGQVAEARSLLEEVHSRDASNLSAMSTLASVAWATGENDLLAKYEAWLHVVEGDAGTLWRFYRGQRLLDEAKSTTDPDFREVSRLSQELEDMRPRWSKTNTLAGNIALRAGNTDGAIAAFRRAWNLGDRSALLADQLIELLTAQGRDREAEAYVMQVRTALSLSSRLFDRAIHYFVEQDQESALSLAEAWVSRQPDDPVAHLRLGRVLLAIADVEERAAGGYRERATKVFFQALKLSPMDIGTWLANLACHRQVRGSAEPNAVVLENLADRLDLGESTRDQLFARVHEELGSALAARGHYRRALQSARLYGNAGDTVNLYENAARFYSERMPELAMKLARQALQRDENSLTARLLMTQLVAESASAAELEEAIALSKSLPLDVDYGTVDAMRRVRARLLAQRGRPADVEAAIELLDTLLQQTSDDRLLLGKLHERTERIGPAFDVFSELASESDARPEDHSAFIRFWQDQFVAMSDPSDDPPFAAIAAAAYSQLLALPSQQSEWLRWKIREQRLRTDQAALDWQFVRDAVETAIQSNRNFAKWPAPVQLAWSRSMLQTLAELGLVEHGMRVVEQPSETLPGVELSIALCHSLILGGQADHSQTAIEEHLEEQLAKHPQRSDLARAVGDYRYMTGRYEGAIDAYRKAQQANPSDKLTANNLALSFVELPGGAATAVEILTEALQEHGRDPVLLDTLAVVELVNGQPQAAMQLIDEALEVDSENPFTWLHAAMAHEVLGNVEPMQDSLECALLLGIGDSLMSQRDRDFFERHFADGQFKFLPVPADERDQTTPSEAEATDSVGIANFRWP
ncbi:MAG: tetratricopeptide repeat protein [Planctomycetota bacterium]